MCLTESRRGSSKSVAVSERCRVQQNPSAGGKAAGQDRSFVLFLVLEGEETEREREVSLIRL